MHPIFEDPYHQTSKDFAFPVSRVGKYQKQPIRYLFDEPQPGQPIEEEKGPIQSQSNRSDKQSAESQSSFELNTSNMGDNDKD